MSTTVDWFVRSLSAPRGTDAPVSTRDHGPFSTKRKAHGFAENERRRLMKPGATKPVGIGRMGHTYIVGP